jgi:hypothetical protein
LLGSDCLSWYISDASFIIAKYFAKEKKEDNKKTDRGAPGIHHKMIQTWVTYELVKVSYIYGLNPEKNIHLPSFAPKIKDYIDYLNEATDNNAHQARRVHELLHDETLHMGV